jgi:hypothetical protein
MQSQSWNNSSHPQPAISIFMSTTFKYIPPTTSTSTIEPEPYHFQVDGDQITGMMPPELATPDPERMNQERYLIYRTNSMGNVLSLMEHGYGLSFVLLEPEGICPNLMS